jgi:hypothetical protein
VGQTGIAPITFKIDASPTGGRMNPIIQHIWTPEERARYGIRGMEDFSAEELALLQAKVAGWMRQRAPQPKSPRHRTPFIMKRRTTGPA